MSVCVGCVPVLCCVGSPPRHARRARQLLTEMSPRIDSIHGLRGLDEPNMNWSFARWTGATHATRHGPRYGGLGHVLIERHATHNPFVVFPMAHTQHYSSPDAISTTFGCGGAAEADDGLP